MSSKTKWATYDYLLRNERSAYLNESIKTAQDSFYSLAEDNPSYQTDATVNGEKQALLMLRTSANICTVNVPPNAVVYIGDLIYCYNENWLVMESYVDEYGLCTAEAWLCNHLFKFQNNTSEIHEIYGVIDDGSYSSRSEKNLTTSDASYDMYVPLDENTSKFYVDKRFAIDTTYNSRDQEILQVMQISWVDKKNQNYGEGSHLLKTKLMASVYDAEKDNLELMICDYIYPTEEEQEELEETDTETLTMSISGKDEIRIGTTRTYTVELSDESETAEIEWSLEGNELCVLTANGSSCTISVPLNTDLIGEALVLTATDVTETFSTTSKTLEVITIG